jgi:hypothetical protein
MFVLYIDAGNGNCLPYSVYTVGSQLSDRTKFFSSSYADCLDFQFCMHSQGNIV